MKLEINSDRIWWTSDFHAFHANIIKYCNRPFKDVIQMNETILQNYNMAVQENDIVFYLGDIAFGEEHAKSFLDRMKGHIHFIVGNHDEKYLETIKNRAETVSDLIDTEIFGQPITMSHYAMRVWHKSHFDSWNLVGHSHGRLQPNGKQYDVGVDNNNFSPVSFDTIRRVMQSRPHNENYLPEEKRR